jgi:hypothetical protein
VAGVEKPTGRQAPIPPWHRPVLLEQQPSDVDRHDVALALLYIFAASGADLMVVLRPVERLPLFHVFSVIEIGRKLGEK